MERSMAKASIHGITAKLTMESGARDSSTAMEFGKARVEILT
jgi:hypothetical protein